MSSLVQIIVGGLTLGLPVWFAFLDRRAMPRLKWVGKGDPPPIWGRMVVVVGVGLAVLLALLSPLSGVDPAH